jgi:hypothetical protein
MTAVAAAELKPLSDVLAYRNPDIIDAFLEDYPVARTDAEEIFAETLKWLWLCARRRRGFETGATSLARLPLLDDLYAVDRMWHVFLLFSEDYVAFCERFFGFYVHHYPITRADRATMTPELRRTQLREAYSMIYDELGPETLRRWCEDYPRRFPKPSCAGTSSREDRGPAAR